MGELLKDGIIYVAQWVINGITSGSYIICLFMSMCAFLYYLAGSKEAGRYIGYSIITYIILEILKVMVNQC